MIRQEGLDERGMNWKRRGEAATWYGTRAADMSRDELLMFIGCMCETLEFQGGQLAQVAKNTQALTDALAAKEEK